MLERSPRTVLPVFDEAIDAEFVRLQVQDGAGAGSIGPGPTTPAAGRSGWPCGLRPLPEATYAASYRVISEDGHPVVKRITFRVRPPMSTAGSGAGRGRRDSVPAR